MATFDKKSAKRISSAVKQIERQGTQRATASYHRSIQPPVLEGFLDADLNRANSEDDPEYADLRVSRGVGEQWGESLIDGEHETVEVCNRSPDFSASEDDLIQVLHVNGEWRPIATSVGTSQAVAVFLFGRPLSGQVGFGLDLSYRDDEGETVFLNTIWVKLEHDDISQTLIDALKNDPQISQLETDWETTLISTVWGFPDVSVLWRSGVGAQIRNPLTIHNIRDWNNSQAGSELDPLTGGVHVPYFQIRTAAFVL